MSALVDTSVLVYRFDPRFPRKQRRATELLRRGIEADDLLIPHQALLEFVAAVSKPLPAGGPLLSHDDAFLEVEAMLAQFRVVYPTERTVRTALRGAALYRLPWFDAHLWAFADEHGCTTLWSEDFGHDRLYGRVRALDPFRES